MKSLDGVIKSLDGVVKSQDGVIESGWCKEALMLTVFRRTDLHIQSAPQCEFVLGQQHVL